MSSDSTLGQGVPQDGRPLFDLNDPKGICKNVTGLGRWGNGDIQVSLRSIGELPYIMGLVRQSYERQMGDGG